MWRDVEEFGPLLEHMVLEARDSCVNIIADCSLLGTLEEGVFMFPSSRPDLAGFSRHANFGQLLFVNLYNPLLPIGLQLTSSFHNIQIANHAFSSVQDAVEYLRGRPAA